MKTCPYCGAMYDESVKICLIDGYDFSSESMEEKPEPMPDPKPKFEPKPKRKDWRSYRGGMWLCPECGGVFDKSLLVCPIDGSPRRKGSKSGIEIKHKTPVSRIWTKIKKRMKVVSRVLLIIAIVAMVYLSVRGMIASGGSIFEQRIRYAIEVDAKRFGTAQERLPSVSPLATVPDRFGHSQFQVKKRLGTIEKRFQYAIEIVGDTLDKVF